MNNGDFSLDQYYANYGTSTGGMVDDHPESNSALSNIKQLRLNCKEHYRRSLLHPKEYKGAKIPSELPLATATAQNQFNFTITPNSSGKAMLIADPYSSTWSVYNDSTFDGLGTAGTPITVTLPYDTTIIDCVRLVSACINVTYVGTLQNCKGYITAAPASNYSSASVPAYFTFANVEDCNGKRTVFPTEGIKMIAIPSDTDCLNFIDPASLNVSSYVSRKNMWIIIFNNLPNEVCIRIDVTRNIEYMSKLNYRDYIDHDTSIPSSMPVISNIDIVSTLKESINNKKQLDNSISLLYNNRVNNDFLNTTIQYGTDLTSKMIGSQFDNFTTSMGQKLLNNLIMPNLYKI